MRIAVTGASGFVGGAVADWLRGRGHTVFPFGRRAERELMHPQPGYVSWDIARGPIDAPAVHAVVHCAATVGDWGDDAVYSPVNVDGTHHMLTTFAKAQRIVCVSTTSVYSDQRKHMLREDADIGNCRYSAYGRTKAQAERIVRERRPDAAILRPHIVYGPGDTTILPRLLRARKGPFLPVPGDGTNTLSVTHVDNLSHAVERALLEPAASGAFNISDAERVTARVLLRTMFERLRLPTRLVFVPQGAAIAAASALESLARLRGVRGPTGPVLTHYAVAQLAEEHTVDIARAEHELGYRPTWTYRDGPLQTRAERAAGSRVILRPGD